MDHPATIFRRTSRPGDGATTLKFVASDGYEVEVKIADCKGTDIVLAYAADGADLLPANHVGQVGLRYGGLDFAEGLGIYFPPSRFQ